ncbi:MAG: dihydroneopterin aldolase [Candidatus Raymondbacteria bacterium RifOxyA12_full_50_37]|uniref:7,8-dihydroneopterin aldolase n=1 Tax=Candidatus Raymondbacteria bacterium RIFOXYD12_FULL_49_13 TaxID=1817890 RepID=A0A1F7FGF5_UNCRA|nr:MAG: dihydroneopterin aldolase [Candidatus Raymondbacteria bacterium RifOxyA12_full_50_37]OGJ92936.1 MAG: dihydroneopterin aldolase [Candidatus Raymondbacteria bacterium RIFOXYA2_FULL_49_16]OGK01371.1 MAG: dihydroneopterin aldolase [Candidatus Raymondbacteria bacterium RifOxyB12_full_50_8]OGK03815.1 MAG: dihydroneopterin aldolase [Candidatus Raymondbacteria bacterium RifOxyC12_full_50_8]OGK05678.1 MAG: dihydroneopterin aldolase [Candidatus Raymondbacteria bacterium RIFOXYD12_FULL_49_13]OGP4
MDAIIIRDLALRAFIGIYPEEQRKKQSIVINIALSVDLRKPGKTDNIDDTVDYKKLKREIITMVESTRFNLVEHCADRIARICLADRRVKKAVVTVDKPGALRFARSVAVTIERARHG